MSKFNYEEKGWRVWLIKPSIDTRDNRIDERKLITHKFDIAVLCFGLRSDFQTKLFPGSKRLFEIADSISEIKSICKCGSKAIVNARFDACGKIEFFLADATDAALPQRQCPNCGKKHVFDYPKCPFCKYDYFQ